MRKAIAAAVIAATSLVTLIPASTASAVAPQVDTVIAGEARGVVSTVVDLAFRRRTFPGYGTTPESALVRAREAMWNFSKHCEEVNSEIVANDGREEVGEYRATVYARCHRLV